MMSMLNLILTFMFQNTFGYLHAGFQTGRARTQHKKQMFEQYKCYMYGDYQENSYAELNPHL